MVIIKELYKISGNKNCQHNTLTFFGSDSGNNEYSYCEKCGAVLIIQGETDPEQEKKKWLKKKEKALEKSVLDRILRK